MLQDVLVVLTFLGAIAYLVFRFMPQKSPKHKDCDKCG